MAVTDIVFQEGEKQDFILEIAAGTLNAPTDIVVVESQSVQQTPPSETLTATVS